MDKWNVAIGDAEIADPWQVQIGDARISPDVVDPWQFEMGPIQDYREYEMSFTPEEVEAAMMYGASDLEDPWQELPGEAEVLPDDYPVGNPDQEGPPYQVRVKR